MSQNRLCSFIQLVVVLYKLEDVVHYCLLRNSENTTVEPCNVVKDLNCLFWAWVFHEQISGTLRHNNEEENTANYAKRVKVVEVVYQVVIQVQQREAGQSNHGSVEHRNECHHKLLPCVFHQLNAVECWKGYLLMKHSLNKEPNLDNLQALRKIYQITPQHDSAEWDNHWFFAPISIWKEKHCCADEKSAKIHAKYGANISCRTAHQIMSDVPVVDKTFCFIVRFELESFHVVLSHFADFTRRTNCELTVWSKCAKVWHFLGIDCECLDRQLPKVPHYGQQDHRNYLEPAKTSNLLEGRVNCEGLETILLGISFIALDVDCRELSEVVRQIILLRKDLWNIHHTTMEQLSNKTLVVGQINRVVSSQALVLK